MKSAVRVGCVLWSLIWSLAISGCKPAAPSGGLRDAADADREAVRLLDRIDRGTDRAASLADLAAIYLDQQRYDEALQRAREAIAIDPTNTAANMIAARVLHWKENFDQAIEHGRIAVASDPACAECAFWLAYSYADAGRDKEAEPWWERAAELRPDNVSYRVNVAINRVRMDRIDEAIAEFRRASSLDDASDDVHRRLINLLLQHDRPQEAQAAIDAGLHRFPQSATLLRIGAWHASDRGDFPAALALAERAVEATPDDARSHHLRAAMLVKLDRGEESLQSWRRSLELDPSQADVRLEYSAALRQLRRYDLAEAELERLRADGRANAEALLRLAAIKFEVRSDPAAAAPVIAEAASMARENAEILEYAGDIYAAAADLDRAYYYYREAAIADPQSAGAHFGVGYALIERFKLFEEAAARFERVIELKPTDGAAWRNLAECSLRLGRWPQAEHAAREGLKYTDDPELFVLLGMAMNEQQRSSEAVEVLRKATERLPEETRAWNALGVALLRTKQPGAAEAFDRAIACSETFAVPRFNRALIAIETKDWKRAHALRDWLQKNDPERSALIDEQIRKAMNADAQKPKPDPATRDESKERF